MNFKTMTLFPYYGGKAKLSYYISSILDYKATNYYEIFGGACNVLINKCPHEKEVYNDANKGLYALLLTIKNSATIEKFISQLYEIDCDESEFKDALEYINNADNDDMFNLNNHDNIFKLAVSTYIVFSQSRDGIGKVWSNKFNKNVNMYYRRIDYLRDIADRIKDIEVNNYDAFYYLNNDKIMNNSDNMFYLDPSYLKPETNINLGHVYKYSFNIDKHEQMLKIIQKAKSKIMISNYDHEIYSSYLNQQNNWNKIYYDVKTTVGIEKNNKRTEVLWYNY